MDRILLKTMDGAVDPVVRTSSAKWKIYLRLIIVMLFKITSIDCLGSLEEICHFETFEAKCNLGEIILMEQAFYGRMELGKCVKTNFGFVGCYANVLDHLDRKCTGKRSCKVEVVEPNFEGIYPCNMELKSFLQAQYRCIPVPDLVAGDCLLRPGNQPIYLPSSFSTFVSDATSDSRMCGSYQFPWVIRAHPGQRLNVTLLDLSWTSSTQSHSAALQFCNPYGTVREFKKEPIEGEKTEDICATSHHRLNHVYTSGGEVVELVLHNPGVQNFIVIVNAVGCPNLDDVSPYTIVKYSGDRNTATVRCQHGKQSWHVGCEGNRWIGAIGNCSSSEKLPSRDSPNENHATGRVFSTALLVVIVVAVSLLMCGSILLLGVFFYRRLNCQKKYTRSKPPPDEILMSAHKEGCLVDSFSQQPDLMQYDSSQAQIQCQIYHAVINECPYMRVLHNPPANCENPECEVQQHQHQSCNTLLPREGTMCRQKALSEHEPQLLQDSNPTYDLRHADMPVYSKYKYDENVDMSA